MKRGLAVIGLGALLAAGVSAIFGPGTNIPEAARDILNLIRKAGAA